MVVLILGTMLMKHSLESPLLFGPKYSLRERSSLSSFLDPYAFFRGRVVVIRFSQCLLSSCQRPGTANSGSVQLSSMLVGS